MPTTPAAWGGEPHAGEHPRPLRGGDPAKPRDPGLIHLYLIFAAEAAQPDHPSHQFFRDRFEQVRRLLSVAIAFEQGAGRIDMAVDADRAARLLIAVADGVQLQALVDPTIDAPKDLAATIAQLRGETSAASRS